MNKTADYVISLLYPRRCPVCDDVLRPGSKLIHENCEKKIKPVGRITCMKCGKPIKDKTRELCQDCSSTIHYFDRGYSVFRYRSVSGSIYRFKYAGRREYADFYGQKTGEYLGDIIKDIKPDAIIPIPMYAAKMRKRGYNQAAVLAKAIGKSCDVPVYENVIIRTRNTVPMKLLDQQGRRSNLKKAFNIRRNDVKFKCIILIDDIYTTGSTVDAVAKEFRRLGVERIYFVTLAIGQVV
ncbi:ComF family protein [Butyrivibrio sp. WCD3002]|jgi:ComF family protein|uniref:ComF family protein n=1 Tax=Butyrivibrio sp. WCD3002 TaxID=1280676 RepID=UPI0003F76230|nr:ComF family protein [Butyrivibrio sp. WCD3002]